MNFLIILIYIEGYLFNNESNSNEKETKDIKTIQKSNRLKYSGKFQIQHRVIFRDKKSTEIVKQLDSPRLERIIKKINNSDIILNKRLNNTNKNENTLIQMKKDILNHFINNLDETFNRKNYLRFAVDIKSSLSNDYNMFVFDEEKIDFINRTIKHDNLEENKASEIIKVSQLSEYSKSFDISKRKEILKKLFRKCLRKKLISRKESKEYVFVFKNSLGHSNSYLVDTFYYPEEITVDEFKEVMNELNIPFSKFTIVNKKYFDLINQLRKSQKHKRLNNGKTEKAVRKVSRSYQEPLSFNEFFIKPNTVSPSFENGEDIFGLANVKRNFDYTQSDLPKKMIQAVSKDLMVINNDESCMNLTIENVCMNSNKNTNLGDSKLLILNNSNKQERNVNLELIFDSSFDKFQVFGILEENNIGKMFLLKFDDDLLYDLILREIKKMTGIKNNVSTIASMLLKNIHSLSDFNFNSIKKNLRREDTDKIRCFLYNIVFLDINLYYKAIVNLCMRFKKGENEFIILFEKFFDQALLQKFTKTIKKTDIRNELDIYLFKKIRILHSDDKFLSSEEYAQFQDMVIQSLLDFKKLISESQEEILETINFLNEKNFIHLRNTVCLEIGEIVSKFLPNINISVNFDSNFVTSMNLNQHEREKWDFDEISKISLEFHLDEYLCDDGEGKHGDKAIFV